MVLDGFFQILIVHRLEATGAECLALYQTSVIDAEPFVAVVALEGNVRLMASRIAEIYPAGGIGALFTLQADVAVFVAFGPLEGVANFASGVHECIMHDAATYSQEILAAATQKSLYLPEMGKKIRITIDVTELGRAGGYARAANLTESELSAAGSEAARARWDQYYADHPEKLKAKLEKEKKAAKKAGK